MRTAGNFAVQSAPKANGEIGQQGFKIKVLDRVSTTREGARLFTNYQKGHIVDIRTDLPSMGLKRGDRGAVTSASRGKVMLDMTGGGTKTLQPDRLPRNLRHDALSIYAAKMIALHQGDRIRFTDNDQSGDMLNGALATLQNITYGKMTISSGSDGSLHELTSGDRMLKHLDLAYAINVHVAQGVTAQFGIIMMSAGERMLTSAKLFMVALTRIVEKAMLIVDNGQKLERLVGRNSGDKTSALEIGEGQDKIIEPRVREPIIPDLRSLTTEQSWAEETRVERLFPGVQTRQEEYADRSNCYRIHHTVASR